MNQRHIGRTAARWASTAALLLAGVSVVEFYRPPRDLLVKPFGTAPHAIAQLPPVAPALDAFGRSGGVRVRFALPNEPVEYPLDVEGDPRALAYQWVRAEDGVVVDSARPLVSAALVAPAEPGFYHLAVVRGAQRRVIDELTLGVKVPFSQKLGATLNGYRIGTYLAERLGAARPERPDGFVEVEPQDVDLPLTNHLRLADFITHDRQQTWPKYVAVNARLLDKLELVVAEIARLRGDTSASFNPELDVHSGFRAPEYNRTVRRAARDSRHQYGDAADVAIDVDGDGRVTTKDSKVVALAVEAVERDHPDLVGGMGLYTSRRYRTPYVHIDARGRRARWQG